MGKTFASATIEDLAAVDEFHIGGRPATAELCKRMHVTTETEVLDVGCGIGGAARFISSTFGCRVTGVDLTPAYIDVAQVLSGHTGLAEQLRFVTASALNMPFDDGSFDRATLLHVGMNIADKAKLCSEVYPSVTPRRPLRCLRCDGAVQCRDHLPSTMGNGRVDELRRPPVDVQGGA